MTTPVNHPWIRILALILAALILVWIVRRIGLLPRLARMMDRRAAQAQEVAP
jgi:F0F1-type ATP synthase membrane subunit b/b'